MWHLDCFFSRDKVYRAAGRRAVGSVFCSPFIKFTLTSKLRTYYRDSYVIRLYLDEKTTGHLPGLAKNSPTLTPFANALGRLPPTQLNRRAVMGNSADPVTVNLDNFVMLDSSLLPRQIRYQRNMPITVLN
jgi:hypothetical protein